MECFILFYFISDVALTGRVVSGAPTPFSKVTEEDQELMTPEEYSAYFEVFQSRAMAG